MKANEIALSFIVGSLIYISLLFGLKTIIWKELRGIIKDGRRRRS